MISKRIFDIVGASILLVAAIPFLLFFALVILISSPGPVFYLGQRTGLSGRPFLIFKFRTMIVDAERKGGGTTALGDNRIFPFGRFLRRYKLDELPQLLNVLSGEMSLVGPRPELHKYTERYSAEEQAILSVLPGITDYSSIRFSALDQMVGESDADGVFERCVLPEKNRLRLKYVRTRSFWVDVKILVLTVWCVARKLVP